VSWLYSFINIPGTIAFLVWLYYYTVTSKRMEEQWHAKLGPEAESTSIGSELYAVRRWTMAVCNLLAFLVFTLWPCMPTNLLQDRLGILQEAMAS
jgi:hypothetical protein